jgi:surfeit locus 1 family protein
LNNDTSAALHAPARRGRFWLITVAALITIGATVSLGRWQLSRAAQKEAVQAEVDAEKSLPPLSQQEFLALGDAAASLHRPVRLRGLWLEPHTVYLDNRQMHDLQGFYVLTPFALEGSNQTVMIQRGWIQRNFTDRTQLQPVETPAGLVEVVGTIAPPPGRLLEVGKAEPAEPASAAAGNAGAARIRQNLDLQAYRTETALPLRTDVTLQQSGPASEGLQRDWPAPALGAQTNYGYAFQWFGIAALVAFLYVWFQLIAPYRRARRDASRV